MSYWLQSGIQKRELVGNWLSWKEQIPGVHHQQGFPRKPSKAINPMRAWRAISGLNGKRFRFVLLPMWPLTQEYSLKGSTSWKLGCPISVSQNTHMQCYATQMQRNAEKAVVTLPVLNVALLKALTCLYLVQATPIPKKNLEWPGGCEKIKWVSFVTF